MCLSVSGEVTLYLYLSQSFWWSTLSSICICLTVFSEAVLSSICICLSVSGEISLFFICICLGVSGVVSLSFICICLRVSGEAVCPLSVFASESLVKQYCPIPTYLYLVSVSLVRCRCPLSVFDSESLVRQSVLYLVHHCIITEHTRHTWYKLLSELWCLYSWHE